jgi:hypothetical protein
MMYCYNIGWFGGSKTPLTIKMESEFEGFSGRASETWEQRFIVETEEITDGGKYLLKHVRAVGATLEEACSEALAALRSAP